MDLTWKDLVSRDKGGWNPVLVPAEFSAWLSERHSDFHDALINGDPAVIEAERLVEMTGRMLL